MKSFLLTLAAAVCVSASAFAQDITTSDVPKREHRAVWMSPFLGSNWPSSAINSSNASSHQRILRNRLAKFKEQNINVIYYHVRSNCDATYKSSYEPWSSSVAGARGGEPAFDPFGYLVEQAHLYGIEVYAWFNPYRYANSTSKTPYGAGERNYENSHPEWLLINSKQSVLNPAIEGVQQRIVDVISEVVTNYDVDGVIFDDYFYGQGGTSMSADAEQYKQYTAAGGKLSQADWRRDNVNRMVHRVHDAIKNIKPYVCFGISPAGVSSPPDVTTKYGLPEISGDWQYNQIYSDPLAWLMAGDIDFISPQIYWPERFNSLCNWWSNAAVKFDRHLYSSVSLSDLKNDGTAEYIREVAKTREVQPEGTAGIAFFQYSDFVNYGEKLFDKTLMFGDNMKLGAYPTKALSPLRPWNNKPAPAMTSNVRIEDGKLVWDAVDAGRYTVYAYPKTEAAPFGGGQAYLHGISYTNSYELPADYSSYDWFVAVYDRYGNEYSPLAVGAVPGTADAPVLTYPAEGENAVDLFDFKWTASAPGLFTVEVSESADFANIFSSVTTTATTASVTGLKNLTVGQKYYWRVRFVPVNAPEVCSQVRSFVADRIRVTSPAHQSDGHGLCPVISWTKAVDGAEYKLEISPGESFGEIVHSVTTGDNTHAVPVRRLMSGRTYYARVTASRNGFSSTSDPVAFSTADRTYEAPVLVTPSADGMVLHCDDAIRVQPWEGMNTITINISSTRSFPVRSSYTGTLKDFADTDKQLQDVKLVSTALADGKTYYVRVRGSYYVNGSSQPKYTDYSPIMSFVYSTAAGVNDVTADEAAIFIDAAGTLHTPADTHVEVYTLSGALVISETSAGTLDLSRLAAGAYLVRTPGATLKYLR